MIHLVQISCFSFYILSLISLKLEHLSQSQVPPEIVFFGDPRKPPPVEAARDVVRDSVQHFHVCIVMFIEVIWVKVVMDG